MPPVRSFARADEIFERERAQASPHVLVSGSLDRSLIVWDVASGKHVATLFGHMEGVWCVKFNTLHIVSGSQDGRIIVRTDWAGARNGRARARPQ